MKASIIFSCLVLLFVSQIQAQEEKSVTISPFRLGIETGANVFFGDASRPEMIRESGYYYHPDDYYDGYIYDNQDTEFFYFGFKPEYTLSKYQRFAISSGIRFSYAQTTLTSDREYFLWKISETGANTNYVRINRITQKNYHIGIPFEVRFFMRKKDSFVRQYFVWGTVLNILLSSSNDVSFKNAEMKKYASNVNENIKKPDFFHWNVYAGVGMKVGKTKYPFGYLEFLLPVTMLGKDHANSLMRTNGAFGFGMQMNLLIPLSLN